MTWNIFMEVTKRTVLQDSTSFILVDGYWHTSFLIYRGTLQGMSTLCLNLKMLVGNMFISNYMLSYQLFREIFRIPLLNTWCFKKSFTILKAYINVFRGHAQCFELSQCSRTHRILTGIVTVQSDFDSYCRVFRKELYNGIRNAAVWLVLQKRLYLKAERRTTTGYQSSNNILLTYINECCAPGFEPSPI
jgi:hypothetical protein